MSTKLNEFINIDSFNLPNHTEEIKEITIAIENKKEKLKELQSLKQITDKTFIRMYEQTIKILDYLGNLSTPAFNIEDKLEEIYIKKYPQSPQLAKKLWLDHYDHIHHNYSLLKNRCFRILDELDELYMNVHDKNPPNWNI